ncbi:MULTISPECIES: glycoside hydrolase family 108 protein [unclassified Shinella]|uniref:glycoside hydrolase family 108 protein n=1 Tax=unclassified Shinella TaxID=2643062 RepID=UPI00225CD63D|nr:Lysozyme family protein [Rhizobiaceae bacterium]CAK7259109.1 Lysozyme family protein [Shinella sp. WSC3-e]
MIDRFQQADERVSVHEGGYVNHPKDPGGATNRGVTQRVYDDYRRRNGLPVRSVRQLNETERLAIYRGSYWHPIKGDQLPPGVGYVVYDGAVNSGVAQSVKWLQRALGVKVDGMIGPTTLAAVCDHPDHDKLIAAICERRMAFLRALKTWPTFGKGWTRRVNEVRATGQAWAKKGTVGHITAAYVPGGEAKARVEDAKPAPVKAVADAATGGGLASGGLAEAIRQAQEQITPLAGSSSFINSAIAALAVSAVVLTVGGLGWRWYAARKQRQRADALDLPA